MSARKIDFYYYNLKNKMNLFIKNPKFILFYINRFRKYNSLKQFDAFIISYPKSGRTWLQKMMIEACKLELESNNLIKDISQLKEIDSDLPSILSTHAGASWEEIVLNHNQIKRDDLNAYKNGKIVFLYRDPRDVLVSQFYHIKNRSGYTNFKKEGMIENSNVGLLKIINFMNKWKDYASKNPSLIHETSYEELRLSTFDVLKEIIDFFEIDIKNENLAKSISNSEIKKMQNAESGNSDSPWSSTQNIGNTNNFQSRKGLIGEYKEFFNTSEIELIDEMINKYLDKSFNY